MSSPRSTRSTPRRGAQKRGRGGDDTPSRRSTRSSRSTEPSSPPAALDSSPGGSLAPLPSSPPSQEQRQNVADTSLFSSPAASRAAASEIDLSSPLNYGTPSSRVGSTPRGSVAGTPRTRVRADIRSERKRREVNLASEAQGPPDGTEPSGAVTSDQPSGPQLVIWGTDVVVSHCKDKFRRFLSQFVVPSLDEDEMEGIDVQRPLYMQKLEEVAISAEPFLNVNCGHLKEFDANLYRQLICYPQEVIPTFDVAVNELFLEKFPDASLEHQVQVRPYNVEKTTNMRNLNPEDIDQLITIGGMVIRTSNLVPEMMVAFFRCHVCHWTCTVEIDRGRIAEPTLCRNCSTQHSMALVHNRSQFGDKQMVKLQESPDDMPPGQTPNTTMVYAHNDLVDSVQPGDRVMVTGIYRATPLRPNPRQRNVKAVYKTHIDVIHFRKFDTKRLTEDQDGGTKISEDRMAEVRDLSQQGDIYERLARALAPSIYENEDIKKGILCQLFGGTKKDFTEAGRGKFRSDINILLCGDPGTSKSQLLQYVYKIMPRSQYTSGKGSSAVGLTAYITKDPETRQLVLQTQQYTSGKGSSAVGLTAYITKDPETRQLVLQTGALVLSDNGVCCIDEFDKMNESTRSILHEVMEQQTLSIAKAGIICSLNARTSILAAANPVESQWNPKKNIIENLNLPHTLLSRFDLIFLILDPQDEIFDRRLANHLVSLYYRSPEEEQADEMDMSLLKDYISYARTNIQPKMSEEASQAFIQAYVEARKLGSGHGNVSAYPRQLESLIRLAEAHAKIRFSSVVELVDVEEAKRLHREALKQSATDPSTGVVDINILTTGMSDAARKRRQEIAQEIMKWWAANSKPRTAKSQVIYDAIRAATEGYLPRDLFDEGGHLLQEDGKVIRTGTTFRFM